MIKISLNVLINLLNYALNHSREKSSLNSTLENLKFMLNVHYAKLPLFGHLKGYFIVVSKTKMIGEVSLDRNFNGLLYCFS